jgi:hypothetical protein
MDGCLSLPSPADQKVAFDAGRGATSLFAKTLCVIFEAIIKRRCLLKMASLHEALLSDVGEGL